MKRLLMGSIAGALVIIGCASPSAAEQARHFFVGANAGSFSVWSSYGASRFGGEIGVHLGKRWALTAEIAQGTSTYKSLYRTENYEHVGTTKLRSQPVFVGVHFIIPINDTFFPYVGAGAEFFSAKLTRSDVFTYGGQNPRTDSVSYKLEGTMPAVKIGIEGTIAGRFAILGEIKQGIGRATIDYPSDYASSSEEIPVGGVEIKAGFRVYF